MDFETLNSFLILSDKLNYTEVSDILGITQPALSKRIRLLEEELNCQLFVRTPREVRLTLEGNKLVPFAKYMLTQAERLKREIKDTGSYKIPLRIGFYGLVVHSYFPAFIQYFRRVFPKYELELFPGNLKYLCGSLIDGRINLLLASESIKPKLKNFKSTVLSRDPVYIMVHKDSPYSCMDYVSITDLKDETFLMLSDHNTYANAFHSNRNALLSEACLYEGISPQVKTVDFLVDLPMMVSCGEGVAIGTKNLMFCSYNNVTFVPYQAPDGKQKYFDLLLYYDDYCKETADQFTEAFFEFETCEKNRQEITES